MSSLPPVPPTPFPSLDNTLGAWLLGTSFGLVMQGMIYHQAYQYYRLYPNDRILLKLWVVAVVFIETLNSALTIHTTYVYLITNYSNPASLFGPPVWSLSILPIPASFAALVSQTFFARRVYLFGPRRGKIAVVTAAMACYLGFFGIFVALSVRTFQTNNFQEFLKFSWMASAGSSLLMVGDFMTTAVLIFTLRRSRTGVIRTDSLLDLLVMYAISTGLLICIFNILNVAFAIAEPDNLIYTAISMVLAKLYANTFLVALITRHSLRSRNTVAGQIELAKFNLKSSVIQSPSTGIAPSPSHVKQASQVRPDSDVQISTCTCSRVEESSFDLNALETGMSECASLYGIEDETSSIKTPTTCH